MLPMFLPFGIDLNLVDGSGSTLMMAVAACSKSPLEKRNSLVTHLLSAGARFDVVGNKGRTALHCLVNSVVAKRKIIKAYKATTKRAIQELDCQLLQILVEAGSDMNMADEDGITAADVIKANNLNFMRL